MSRRTDSRQPAPIYRLTYGPGGVQQEQIWPPLSTIGQRSAIDIMTSTPQRDAQRSQGDLKPSSPPQPRRSYSPVASTVSSDTKQKMKQAETEKAILELESKKNEELDNVEDDLTECEDKIAFYQAKIDRVKSRSNPDVIDKATLNQALAVVEEETRRRNRLKVTRSRIEERFQRKSKELEKKLEVDKTIINLSLAEQVFDDNEKQLVEAWKPPAKDILVPERNEVNNYDFDKELEDIFGAPKTFQPVIMPEDDSWKFIDDKVNNEVKADPEPEPKVKVQPKDQIVAKEASPTEKSTPADPIAQLASAIHALGLPRQTVKELPEFTGQPEKWPIFIKEYERTTLELKIKNSENLIRLRKALKGAAWDAVSGLIDEPDSIPTIIATLRSRFGRPELILKALTKRVRECKAPDINKPASIVAFGTEVRNLVTRVRSMKQDQYLHDVSLLDTLIGKLPPVYAKQWIEWMLARNAPKNLESFAQWMGKEVRVSEQLFEPEVKEDFRGARRHGVHAMAERLDKKCVYCDDINHAIWKCEKFKKLDINERWDVAKEKKLCFCCLGNGHPSTECKWKRKCNEDGCESFHHRLLHRKKTKGNPEGKRKPNERAHQQQQQFPFNPSAPPFQVDNAAPHQCNTAVTSRSLPVIMIHLHGPTGSMRIPALLDSGATCSLLEEGVAKELGLEGTPAPFSFTALKDEVRREPESMVLNVNVSANKKYNSHQVRGVHTVKKLGVAGISLDVDDLKLKYRHLRQMQCRSFFKAVPKMLIGFEDFRLFVPRRILESNNPNEPSAYQCHLGWYVCEPKKNESHQLFHFQEVIQEKDNLNDIMLDFFSVENLGVKVVKNSERSKDDNRALKLMEKNTKEIGKRYETCLLWKEDDSKMPESRVTAMKRLTTMERKMDRDEEFAKLCEEKFNDYIKKKYLIPVEDIPALNRFYLPWFFVFHLTKKPRLVFDAAAKTDGKCLNDFLLKGPDLLNSLPAVLLRFRRHSIALTADIKEMFHQVVLREEDRPAQTVLYRGRDRKGSPQAYEMSVLFFGSASSPCSAIYVKNLSASRYMKSCPKAVAAANHDMYMDDYLGGAESVEETKKLQQDLWKIHDDGGFPLIKWNSSSSEVLSSIPEDMKANGAIQLMQKSDVVTEKTLGLYWNPANDSFGFKLNFQKVPPGVVTGEQCPTKRQMTSILMAVFDPLGYIAHFKVKGLILLQDVWRSQIGWDDEIPNEVNDEWKKWLSKLNEIKKLNIQRRFCPESLHSAENIQLHIFVDASNEAYAATAYLRIQTRGSTFTTFIMGKARVAPIKQLSIPRLELMAALIGARMSKAIIESFKEDMKISKTVYWSDSKTVLWWIRSRTLRYTQFVANRIGEILEITKDDDWKWVPTKENVADEATRLKQEADLTSSSRWLNAPPFLKQDESQWPKEETDVEHRSEDIEVINVIQNLPHVNATRFSSWFKLIHSAATFFMAIRRFRKIKPYHVIEEDMELATKLWIKKCQEESFPTELKLLKEGKEIPKGSRLYGLSPALEDDIIVLRGRLENAVVATTVRRPPILNPNHHYTRLLIQWYHEKSQHFGQERVVNELRKVAWIIDCRSAVKKVVRECRRCRIKKAVPAIPEMGQLPGARVEEGNAPFHQTGVDYFGPFKVKVNRSTVKRWGVMFSCMATRAVHLELAESLDTNAMINALVRFISLRGRPTHIWSDNGTNFVGAEREMRESLKQLDQKLIEIILCSNGIYWHFIPPAAPHMGGSWERLIGSVKKILYFQMHEQEPKEDVLRTFFAEIVSIMNGRPLTYLSPDPNDPLCLTPNDLLNVKNIIGPTIPGRYEEDDKFRKSWRYGQKLALDFWKRWSLEYLPWLAKRQAWHKKVKPLEVGDVVIVLEDNAPRNNWKKGIIVATYPAPGGQVRFVDVKIASVDPQDKKKVVKVTTLRRPATKICPLNLNCGEAGASERENVVERTDDINED